MTTTTVMAGWTTMTMTTMAKTARATARWMTMDASMIEDWTPVATTNLLPRVGKRKYSCNTTNTEEEAMVADLVVIHTTIKQIIGRGGGRW